MRKLFAVLSVCLFIVVLAACESVHEDPSGVSQNNGQVTNIKDNYDPEQNQSDTPDYANGVCGTELNWKLSQDGMLRILGSGAMSDFPYDDSVPWDEFRDMIKSVVIENGVTSIGRYAFIRCENLETISLPESITEIGLSAFQSCTSLKTIDLPDNIEELPKQAFTRCSSLESIKLPKNLQRIQDYAFSDCASLGQIVIPDSTWYIGNNVFEECTALKTAEIGGSARALGSSAFAFCTSLETINVPSGITNLSNTFMGCTSLRSVYFEGNAPVISDRAFTDVTGTCYYPSGDNTWTISKVSDYSGNLTWKAK